MSKLQEHIKEIKETKSGYERNMYPSIKSIFESLGHKSKNIIVDSGSELGQGIPDLVIKTEVGTKEKGKPILGDWVVCEVKDERTAFKTPGSRNKILKDKEKYITLDTNYFIMIDPERMVIRPVTVGSSLNYDSSKDIVIEWEEALKHNDQWFKEQTASIAADKSSIKVALDKFRTGDTSSIAVISLKPQDTTKAEQKRAEKAKQEFFHAIKRATILLQSATKEALEDVQPKIEEILKAIDDFEEKYDGVKKLSLEPFELQGQVIGYERALEHDEDVERIKEKVMSNISIAKLALVWLPEFRSRIGKKKEEVIQELFAIETANMILARILLLRFFEDHGFFGEKRYLCNGGIKAFQMMREYFELTYMKLLKDVYEKAKTIYYSVFEEMELDWVLGSENERLSQAIELSLMHFSKFDFTTIRGDILTGIYDRFLEGSQRKKLGEYYTKPSVARYIIDRIEIDRDDVVLDPACGSGTFLLEVFNKTIGEHIDAGVVTYEEAVEELSHIRGNDINPFSSMIAQIQILWHLLAFKKDILNHGFPRLYIAEKHNSLIPADILSSEYSTYVKIDKKEYDAVIGNPPFVRPERKDEDFSKDVAKFYSKDIKIDKNLFTLFIYRALKSWCKDGAYLGYVIPLSFCDNKSNSNLRKLFLPFKQRWKIVEIVDMEAISEYVFDASVQPIIFIAKNEPASEDDVIRIKIAGTESLLESGDIDLNKAPYADFKYMDVWSKDGRILTKINSERKKIIDKLLQYKTFEDIAFRYWVLTRKNRIIQYGLLPEFQGMEENDKIEERTGIARGAVFRGKKPKKDNGFNIYKGENIAAGLIEGEPAENNIDILNVDDPSLWRYLDILPNYGFAFLQISLGLTAARFKPKKEAFLDTATLFFPSKELRDFPFDLLILSSVYQFFYGIYARMGVVEQYYSHVYPLNLKWLPWSDKLSVYSDDIEAKRKEYYEACKALHNREEALMDILEKIGAKPFTQLCRDLGASNNTWGVKWSEIDDDRKIQINAPEIKNPSKHGDAYRIYLTDDVFTFIEIGNEFAAKAFGATLTIYHGKVMKKSDLLRIKVPENDDALNEFVEEIKKYDQGEYASIVENIIYQIDEIVGKCFGLSEDEIRYIQKEMKHDPYLKHIKPKLPFSGKKKRGLFASLASSDRYK